MDDYQQHAARIKEHLRQHPEGATILDIAAALGTNRNSVAKYLEVLRISGQLDVRSVGPAKLYKPSHRVPVASLLDQSHEAILVLDSKRVLQANDGATTIYGKGLVGKASDTIDLPQERLAKALAGKKQSFDLEKGSKTYAVRLLPTGFDDGTIGVTAVLEDVTRERADQERLRLLERAVQASSSGITIADMTREDQPLIYVNPAFERMTGYKAADILGKNCRFLQGDDRDQEAIAAIARALERGEECTVQLRNYRKDGSMFWNELHLAPVRGADGTVTHFVGIQTEITRRK